jgi:hypothetical protein
MADPAKTVVTFAHLERILEAMTKRFDSRISKLRKEVESIPHDGGVHEPGKQYKRGALVTHGGSVFIAQCDTEAPIGGDPPSPDWRLFCQRGRSAR